MDDSFIADKYYRITMEENTRACVLFQRSLKITIDGDMYSVLLGSNLQEGVVGFGKSLSDAMMDFDCNYDKKLPVNS